MAGGGKTAGLERGPQAAVPTPAATRRLSTSQLVLIAAIVGLLIGIFAGFIALML